MLEEDQELGKKRSNFFTENKELLAYKAPPKLDGNDDPELESIYQQIDTNRGLKKIGKLQDSDSDWAIGSDQDGASSSVQTPAEYSAMMLKQAMGDNE